MRANRAYRLIHTRGSRAPAFLASPSASTTSRSSRSTPARRVLFWDAPARRQARRARCCAPTSPSAGRATSSSSAGAASRAARGRCDSCVGRWRHRRRTDARARCVPTAAWRRVRHGAAHRRGLGAAASCRRAASCWRAVERLAAVDRDRCEPPTPSDGGIAAPGRPPVRVEAGATDVSTTARRRRLADGWAPSAARAGTALRRDELGRLRDAPRLGTWRRPCANVLHAMADHPLPERRRRHASGSRR